MKRLDLTLPSAAENLALDEALLDAVAEVGEQLRFWQSPSHAVILGRASRVADEVDLEFCQRHGVPVLRRCSGGATVVIGPGCLMYGVTLSVSQRPELSVIDHAHQLVLDHLQRGLALAGVRVAAAGTCDLVLEGRKFSGNALRCKKDAVLYHGTLLYDGDLEFIDRCLRMPARQPDYRAHRSHLDFLINLPMGAAALQAGIAEAWGAEQAADRWPHEATRELVRTRYSQHDWHFAR